MFKKLFPGTKKPDSPTPGGKIQKAVDEIGNIFTRDGFDNLEVLVVVNEILKCVLFHLYQKNGKGHAIETLNNLYHLTKDDILNL